MLNLTRQERGVVLFLSALMLIGTGINFLAKRYSQSKFVAYLQQDIGKFDLNQADREMLIDIPGIGEKLAQRILDYRQGAGGFKELDELKEIKGITNYRYNKLKGYLYIK